MASNINPANIDGTYPIAGQDNDSQGFRDNFTNIKNNFTYAQTEVNDLQSKVILKSALTGSTLDNSFVGASMNGAQIVDFRETINSLGTTAGAITINHKTAHYHTVTLNNDCTISFSNFPAAGQLGRVRIEFNITSTNYQVQLPAAVTIGNTYIRNLDASNLLTFDTTGKFTYEFTSTDGGTNYAILDLTRAQVIGANRIPTAIGQLGDTPGLIAWNGTGAGGYLYVCTGYYDGSTNIWSKVQLLAI